MPVPPSEIVPPEVGGVDQGGARRVQLRHEGVEAAAEGRLKGAGRGREVGGTSAARYVGVAGGVHRDAGAIIIARAAEVGGVDQGGARRVQLRHEGVEVSAAVGRLKGAGRGREVGGSSEARHVGVAGSVHGDAPAKVTARAAEVGGVDQGGARRVQLRHEGVEVSAAVGRLKGAGRGREVGGSSEARHVGVAGGVYHDAFAFVIARAAEVGGVDQGGARRVQLRHEGVKVSAGRSDTGTAPSFRIGTGHRVERRNSWHLQYSA